MSTKTTLSLTKKIHPQKPSSSQNPPIEPGRLGGEASHKSTLDPPVQKSKSTTESTIKSTTKPTTESTIESTTKPTIKSTTKPTIKSTTKPTTKPTTTPQKKPTRRISIRTPKKVLPPKVEGQLNPVRKKMLHQFEQVFQITCSPTDTDYSSIDTSTLGQTCEQALYEIVCLKVRSDYPDPKFVNCYLYKGLNLVRNLNPIGSIKNDYLLPKMLAGDISPTQLVQLPDQELYPPKWQLIKEKQMKDITAQTDSQNRVVATSIYKCGKCKEAKCSYYQQQTRSGDESMTTFITCLNCGNKWRD